MKRMYGLLLLPLLCTLAMANGVGNLCPSGTCVIDNPVYVNVYWDPQWDGDVQAAGRPDLLHARIDALVTSLINSAYFSQLAQYKVYTPEMAPSIVANCGVPPSSMDAVVANGNSLLNSFAECVTEGNPSLTPSFNSGNLILNVYIPPTVPAGKWGYGSNHKKIGQVEVDLIPTNQQGFNSDVSRVLELTSHEMVEAATDPSQSQDSPTGYKNRDVGSQFGQEIGDLCPDTSVFPFLGVGPSFAGATVQNGVTNGKSTGVTQYWSDNANNCVIPFAMTPPLITGVQLCGWGKNTHITLSGTFGPRPWDLASGQYNGQTLFVRASIVHQNGTTWSAGNTVMGGDVVGFGSVSWTHGPPDTITIGNFDSNYGPNGWTVNFGDAINVTVFSTVNGQPSNETINTPQPNAIIFNKSNLRPNPSSKVNILGQVVDASSCIIGGVPVALSTSGGTLSSPSVVTTDDSGNFTSILTTPAMAGPVTVTANSLYLNGGGTPAKLSFEVTGELPGQRQINGPITQHPIIGAATGPGQQTNGNAPINRPFAPDPFNGAPTGPSEQPLSVARPGLMAHVVSRTCEPGFVWREAFGGDQVCVIPQARDQAAADNRAASARQTASGQCVRGYVWRAANPQDRVCVTPQTRAQTAQDNASAHYAAVR